MRTIFTCIFGGVDELKEPFVVNQHWKYVCYTDQDFESNAWEIRKVPVMACGPTKTARWYKINFHEHIETDESLYIDGTFFVNTNLDRWFRKFTPPMTVINHPFDKCIYTDVQSCIKGGKGNFFDLVRQANDYKTEGLPVNNGLISSGILMRRKTKEVIKLCREWWEQVEKYSERDQIAFGYAAWKNRGIFNTIDWDYTKRTEFIHCPHLTKPWRDARHRQIMDTYGTKGT